MSDTEIRQQLVEARKRMTRTAQPLKDLPDGNTKTVASLVMMSTFIDDVDQILAKSIDG